MDLIHINDLAGELGKPVKTLLNWRYQGVGPRSAKIGRGIYYRESDVRAWLDQLFSKCD